ncbi:MAG: ATP-binding protein [Bacteroidia bacterium]
MTIIIFGLPGSGKSVFAEAMAARLGAAYLSSDRIRIGMHQHNRYASASKSEVYEELKLLTLEALNQGERVVVDATFFRQGLRENFTRGLPGKWYFIEIFADDNVIRSRLQYKRPYSEADYEVFQKIKTLFEPLEQPHLKLDSGLLSTEEMLQLTEGYLISHGYGSITGTTVNQG